MTNCRATQPNLYLILKKKTNNRREDNASTQVMVTSLDVGPIDVSTNSALGSTLTWLSDQRSAWLPDMSTRDQDKGLKP
jgi:hypothetical protein